MLLDRAFMLVACGYMQDSVVKQYRVGVLRGHVVSLSGGALSHLWVRGRRLWLDRFIGGALLPRLDYSLWVVYKQMQFHMDMGSRRGQRYQACLPARGQRTRTNSRTVRRVTRVLLDRF
jgi:hypothetical protein